MSISASNKRALSGIALLFVGGLGVAAPARADDTQDEIFFASLAQRGISCSSLPGCQGNQLNGLAHALCTDIGRGADPPIEVNFLISNLGFSPDQATGVVGSAIGAYCPQFLPALHQEAGN